MKLSYIAQKSAKARGGLIESCKRIADGLEIDIPDQLLKDMTNPRGKGPTKVANELDAVCRFIGEIELAVCGPVYVPEIDAAPGEADITGDVLDAAADVDIVDAVNDAQGDESDDAPFDTDDDAREDSVHNADVVTSSTGRKKKK